MYKNDDFEMTSPPMRGPYFSKIFFKKFMTFLKSEFCGLQKNDQKFYPMCFGGREIAKNKVSKVLVDTLYQGEFVK